MQHDTTATAPIVQRSTDKAGCENAIDEAIERALGDALRRAFSDIAAEPVPDRFLELLKELTNKPGSEVDVP
jgi:hypothetical protein